MSAAQLAVLVLARALCDTDTRAPITVAAIEVGAKCATRAIGVFHTGGELGTEPIAPAMACSLVLRAIVAVTVRIRIVLTVHETDAAVSTATGTCFSCAFCQDCTRKCRSQGCASNGTRYATNRGSAADLFVSQSFGDIFEPISHRHLLVVT
jgi:hypothetical protein